MKRRGVTGRSIRHGLLLLVLSIALFGFPGCRPGTEGAPERPPLKLTLAVMKVPYSGLIAIAEEKGYFREEGLEVSLRFCHSGRLGLEAVVRGEAGMATVSSMAFASKALEEPSLRILASIGTTTGGRIVGRRDRGIRMPADLIGKRVGFSSDTESDYLLYAFLLTEGIPLESVTRVDLPPDRQAEALVDGEVDAVSAFEIHAFEASRRLGALAVPLERQTDVSFHWLLATREEQLRSSDAAERLLRALVRASDYVRDNEDEAKELLARKWGFPPEFLESFSQRDRLEVSFNQSIVTSQINFVGWNMRRMGMAGSPPDVMEYMEIGVLERVAPESVTVFR